MQKIKYRLLPLVVLFVLFLMPVVSASENQVSIMYLGYGQNAALQKASTTNEYHEYINFTNVNAYDNSSLQKAANNGLIEAQDLVFVDMLYSPVYNSIMDALESAHDNGTVFVDIRSENEPDFFDYIYRDSSENPVRYYYDRMGTKGTGLENAEKLLICLAKEYADRSDITAGWNVSIYTESDWAKIKILYLGHNGCPALELANQTNRYKDDIEFSTLEAYNETGDGPSSEFLAAAESGFLKKQDIIICDNLSSAIYKYDSNLFPSIIVDGHTYIVNIEPQGTLTWKYYYNYVYAYESNETTSGYFGGPVDYDTAIGYYYDNMGNETEEEKDNAENLLIYLSIKYGYRPKLTDDWTLEKLEKIKMMYLGAETSEALELAANNSRYSNSINFTSIKALNSSGDPSEELLSAAESGLIGEQDLIFCDRLSSSVYETLNDTFLQAHSEGAGFVSISSENSSEVPSYFDYASDGLADDSLCKFYRYMGTDGTVRQKNAEYLLHYLAENYANRQDITGSWDLIHIAYLGYGTNSALELANELNPYSSSIELLNLNAYDGLNQSEDVILAGKSGILEMQDVIICDMLSSGIYEALEKYLEAAHANGTTIIDIYSFDPPSSAPDYVNYAYKGSENCTFCNYFLNMSANTQLGIENAENLLIYLSKTYGNDQDLTGGWSYVESSGSGELPSEGIYYPGTDNEPYYFEDTSTYLTWYELNSEIHRSYDPEKPTIGICFHREDIQNGYTGVVDAMVRDIESKDCNVIVGFNTFDNVTDFYGDENGDSLIQCMISFKAFRFNYYNADQGIEDLEALNVPVLRGLVTEDTDNESDICEENRGINVDEIVRKTVLPDLDGIFEFVVVGAKTYNNSTGFYEYTPIPSQVDWLVNRSIKWAELKRKENSEKKVVVIYYNYPSGKDNVATANYLDGITSLCKLVGAMKENGYNIDYVPEDSDELLDRLMAQGYNAGSWAEGMLNDLVVNRTSWGVELVPVETYHEWFKTLPENLQNETIQKWGEPWDESCDVDTSPMIWENSSGRYIVLPAVRCGSVWLMPQPARGFFQDEDALYHNTSVPPTHQYIAFYMWLNKDFKPDALIHLGTHGTHEWLPGQSYGLNTSEWSPILLGDLPNIYPYIVANVGEGETAEYRGNALIIDHLTPTMERAGAYSDLQNITSLMQQYYGAELDSQTKMSYQKEIIAEIDRLSLDEGLDVNVSELNNYTIDEFEIFVRDVLHEYIEDVEDDYIAYGMHVLSVVPSCDSLDPQKDELTDVIRALLGNSFEANVTNAFYQGYPNGIPEDDTKVNTLVWEVIRNGADVQEAQELVYGQSNSSVSLDLERALGYLDVVFEPDDSELFTLIKLIVGDEFKEDVEATFYSNTTEYPNGIPENDTRPDDLLWNVICEYTDPEPAQDELYGWNDSSVTEDLEYGIYYEDRILYPHWDELAYMVRSLLGSSFETDVETAFYSNTTEYPLGVPLTDTKIDRMVREVIVMNSTPGEAQMDIYGSINDTISSYLLTGLEYKQNLLDSDVEVDRVISALDGCYIPPGPGDDPVSRPASVPTGRNFYGINPDLYPSKATWNTGKALAEQMLEDYYENHGTYPQRVAFSRFGVDFIQDHGTLEAEVLYMLGVKPVWDESGTIQGLELIPEDELTLNYDSSKPGRPRIDIVYVTAGMRDAFPTKIEMIDEAVKMANLAPSVNYPNYVNESTQKLYDELYKAYLNETGNATEAAALAKTLSTMRCFAVQDGTYELGVSNLVESSGSWDDEADIAELYLKMMGYAYGNDVWGYESSDLLSSLLKGVDATVHSSTSNLYDAFDNDDLFQYYGGVNLAIHYLSGEWADMYISDTRDSSNPEMITLQEFIAKNLLSTYYNDKYIEGMMKSGYSGASMFSEFVDNVFGWSVTTDLITDDTWNKIYETYIEDAKVSEWLDDTSPGAFQSITGRLLEAARKGYWNCDSETLKSLATAYAESVVENGATCCHHTCGNPLLTEFVEGQVSVPGYSEAMNHATQSSKQDDEESEPQSSSHSSSSSTGKAEVVSSSGNQTQVEVSDGGYGTDLNKPAQEVQKAAASNYVEGYEMSKESPNNESTSSGMSFSGADIRVMLFVILSLGAIYLGFWKK